MAQRQTKPHDYHYIDLVSFILSNGARKPNRTGVDTIGIFGHQMKFDLRDGSIPLLTTKKVHTKSIIHELLWMMSGSSNIKYLNNNGVTIWDEWADENGDLGPVYGSQWRKWPAPYLVQSDWPEEQLPSGDSYYQVQRVDQIAEIVYKLKNNPNDRRMIVSAWNVGELPQMKLPPCHYSFQLYTKPLTAEERLKRFVASFYSGDLFDAAQHSNITVEGVLNAINFPKYELSLLINQRSCDVGLGVPFNIVQYSFLLRMFAEVANMVPGDMIWNGGDVHIYTNHIDALTEQVKRKPKCSPTLKFARKITDIDDFKYDDFIIEGYDPDPAIKMDVAV